VNKVLYDVRGILLNCGFNDASFRESRISLKLDECILHIQMPKDYFQWSEQKIIEHLFSGIYSLL
jgi:hypothetical protein